MIIDGKDQILGRIASTVAKKALEGEEVTIVNCEEMIITGKKENIFEKFTFKREVGHPYHGPFYPRMPDRMVRRTIRSMLPYKQERGRKAFKRIQCFIGIPQEYMGKEITQIKGAGKEKLRTLDFISLKKLAQFLGKKIE